MLRRIKLFSVLRGKPSAILPRVINMIAEGDFGDGPAIWYWRLAGLKLWITAAIAVVGFGLETFAAYGLCVPGGPIDFSCQGAAATLYSFAAFLGAVGLYDGAVRSKPPDRY